MAIGSLVLLTAAILEIIHWSRRASALLRLARPLPERILVPEHPQIRYFLTGDHIQITIPVQIDQLDQVELGAGRAANIGGDPVLGPGRV